MYEIKIDIEKCTGCAECIDMCPNDVCELVDEKATVINADDCVGCMVCVDSCATEAIEVIEE